MERQLTEGIVLHSNYPNPFNPTTSIVYELAEPGHVHLEVYNSLGQRVATLVDGKQGAGRHRAVFDATGLSSGPYFYRLRSGSYQQTRSMMMEK